MPPRTRTNLRGPKTPIILARTGMTDHAIPPFVVAVDQREQLPYCFANYVRIASTQQVLLPVGDYGLLEYPHLISIERKTLSDLFSTLSSGTENRQRFLRQCEAMSSYPHRAIIIEATLEDITFGSRHSDYHPNALLGSLDAIWARFGIPSIFAGNRELAEDRTANLLAMAHAYAYAQKLGLERVLQEGDL